MTGRAAVLGRRAAAAAIATTAVVLVLLFVVLDRIATWSPGPGGYPVWIYPFLVAAVAAPAVVGALLVWGAPTNPVAWILVAGALSVAIVTAADPYARVALVARPGSLPGGPWAAVVAQVWPALYAWPVVLAFVFPDGRLPGPRWRWPARLGALSVALLVAELVVLPVRFDQPVPHLLNPIPVRPAIPQWMVWIPDYGLLATLFLGATAMAVRYRRSLGETRLQILWLALAALLVPVGLLFCLACEALFGHVTEVVFAVLLLIQVAMAAAVGIAVARYRLYAIDRLLNRALVYGALTATLLTGYVVIVLVGGVIAGGGSPWVTAVATLVVAIAFMPLRRRLQAVVDWQFDRPRYVGLRMVRRFVEEVRDGRAEAESVGEILSSALRDPTADVLFRLPASGLYVDRRGVEREAAKDGRVATPIEQRGHGLGVLLHDPRLLQRPDLLRSVLRAATLAVEVGRLRAELRLQLSHVEESRARIAQAEYEERRRLERDLHDGAQQRLVSLGLTLRRLQRSLPPGARILEPALDAAVDEVMHAIADVRSIAAGIRPPRLDDGLAPALDDLARAAPVPMHVRATRERFAPDIEAAAYFVVCEALTNAVKHAEPSRVDVEATRVDGKLRLVVADDGRGGAKLGGGSGLIGLTDRVEAQGGALRIVSDRGSGTRVEAEFPCAL